MTALGGLFKGVLENAVGGHAVIFDYGNSVDFGRLWDAGKGTPAVLSEMNGKRAAVIVWDSRAENEHDEHEKLLAPHLTPLDWALAFSIKVLGSPTIAKDGNFHIHIVDLTGKAHDEWAIRMRYQLLAEMPWVALHAPLIPKITGGGPAVYREKYEPILDGENSLLSQNNGAWQLNKADKTLAIESKHGRGKDLVGLAMQWAASLAQSGDHHDINNIIGADILARPQHRRKGLPGAFLTRLAWSGYDFKTVGDWKPWEAYQAAKALFHRSLSVFVIDDQLQQGWGHFVCRLLNDEQFNTQAAPNRSHFAKLNQDKKPDQKVKVYGCLSSEPLVDFLKRACFDQRLFSQQICVGNDLSPQPQLILLDLRLYAGLTEARTRAKELLDIVNRRAQGGLAWRAIDSEEISRIAAWCEGKLEDARVVDEALLLLPRLLALALPLTPIILFSSTGRAWIKERLKPYQNIFTGFEKPRVLSEPESIEASITALHEGLDKAVGMMRLRLQLAHAQQAVSRADMERPVNDRLSTHHVEIYADETRSLKEGITSGLAVCVYPNSVTADALQGELQSQHDQAGIVWAKKKGGNDPQLAKGEMISIDSNKCQLQVGELANVLNQVSLGDAQRRSWSAVATRMPKSIPGEHSISLAAFPDGPLDAALRFNLEFTLYVLIPFFSNNGHSFDGTINLYIPTRVVPYLPKLKAFATDLCRAFDLGIPIDVSKEVNKRKQIVKYLVPTSSFDDRQSRGTAFPLVRGWLHEWRGTSPVPPRQITRIKMTNLSKGTNQGITNAEASSRRLFHDIADWVCTASVKLWKKDPMYLKAQLKQRSLFPHWFASTDEEKYATDTENAFVLMRALKASFLGTSRDGSDSDALRLVLRNSYVETCDDRLVTSEYCAQQRLILWMLRHELDHARGRGLHSLLAADAGSPEGATDHSRADDQPLAEMTTNEQQGEISGQGPAVEQSVSPSGDEASPEVLASEERLQVTREEQLLQLLDEENLKSRFPGYGPYEVVNLTKFGDVFFKPFGEQGSQGTHRAHDRGLASQLRGEGWASPIIVYGMEMSGVSTGDPVADIYVGSYSQKENNLRVVAVKLADGRWKVIKAGS